MTSSARRGPGRPPESSSAETRARIIQAAREVFGEYGYAATTFQAIATRSDVTRPAINYYFDHKRALYRELVAVTVDEAFRTGIECARFESTLTDKAIAFASGVGKVGAGTAALIVTALHEAQHNRDLSDEGAACMDIARRFADWAIEDAIRTGEIASASAGTESLTDSLVATLFGFTFYAGYVDRPTSPTRAKFGAG